MSDYANARYAGDAASNTVFYHYNNGRQAIQLNPEISQKVYNHSPDGFNWGYTGSGPAQLALAILLDLEDEVVALRLYQKFKREVIAKLPQGKNWELMLVDILKWIDNELDNENENMASSAPIP